MSDTKIAEVISGNIDTSHIEASNIAKKNWPPARALDIRQKLEELDCDPFSIMADLAKSAEKEEIKLSAARELAQYIAPKLKSIDMQVKGEQAITITVTKYCEVD